MKDVRQVAEEILFYIGKRQCPATFLAERRHTHPGKPTGIDPGKGLKINVNVQGQPMEGDSVANGNADAAQLLLANPDAMIPRISNRDNPTCRSQANHHLFEAMHIFGDTEPSLVQMQYRVQDQLPRTMVGDIATTLNVHQGDLPGGQKLLGDHEVLTAAAPAEGKGGRVLGDKEKIVYRLPRPSSFHQGQLQGIGRSIVDQAKIDEPCGLLSINHRGRGGEPPGSRRGDGSSPAWVPAAADRDCPLPPGRSSASPR